MIKFTNIVIMSVEIITQQPQDVQHLIQQNY